MGNKKDASYEASLDGGEGGIRTHDELPRTRFPGERPRPLGDLYKNLIMNFEF